MDMVEVNPALGANQEAVEATASLAVDVIASCLGQTREGAHTSIDDVPPVKDSTEQLRIWGHRAQLWTLITQSEHSTTSQSKKKDWI